jgi:hypothetical protein
MACTCPITSMRARACRITAPELRPVRRTEVLKWQRPQSTRCRWRQVRLTNPDEVYLPKLGSDSTKRKLVEY